MYLEPETNIDNAKCIMSLIDTCTKSIEMHGYSDEDLRTITMANIRAIATSSIMIQNLFNSWQNGDEDVKYNIPRLLGINNPTEKSVFYATTNLNKTTKLSLILLCQFQIEHFIRKIAEIINCPPSNGPGFYTYAKDLIKFLDLEEKFIEELNVCALIRNSLHSNGIHSGYRESSSTTIIEGTQYKFIHAQKVSCASYAHIAHALENSVKIINKIIEHEKVKAHTQEIHDEYRLQTDDSEII